MTGEIRVHVVDYGRKFLQMRYVDPETGRQVLKSTKLTARKQAEKVAAVWEAELNSGRTIVRGSITWGKFRDLYEDRCLSGLKKTTVAKACGVLNQVEKYIDPPRLRDLTAQRLARYQVDLRNDGREEATIAGHMAHVHAMLQWAVDQGYLAEVPKIPKVRRAKSSRGKAKVMKGRPITGTEFRKMLRVVHLVVGKERAPEFRRYLHALWLGGLRLEESLELWWDRDAGLRVVTVGKHWMLRIPAVWDKGNEERILPIAPEFEMFLRKTPVKDRHGRVFKIGLRDSTGRLTMRVVSRIVSDIGKQAGVIVDERKGKFASAHDLRRSFGERWAQLVMPQVLMQLMRHEDISTTMRYYVGRNAEVTANVLWEAKNKGKEVSQ